MLVNQPQLIIAGLTREEATHVRDKIEKYYDKLSFSMMIAKDDKWMIHARNRQYGPTPDSNSISIRAAEFLNEYRNT